MYRRQLIKHAGAFAAVVGMPAGQWLAGETELERWVAKAKSLFGSHVTLHQGPGPYQHPRLDFTAIAVSTREIHAPEILDRISHSERELRDRVLSGRAWVSNYCEEGILGIGQNKNHLDADYNQLNNLLNEFALRISDTLTVDERKRWLKAGGLV